MEIENHPFIKLPDYKVDKIILGSFACLKKGSYGEWFYLASGKSHFWRLIEKTFEKVLPTTQEKKDLMKEKQIWLTDVATQAIRKKENHGCLDTNLKIIKYNINFIQKVFDSNHIEKVLCTSVWVAELWEKKITPKLSLSQDLELIRLPSPSPMADRAIRNNDEYKKLLETDKNFNTFQFRLQKFKEGLGI
ncbi:MAG: hypothetical protein MUC49_18155 [Raineya sp.]|jgi:G:T/U-mismatch repair DNA glycosylase|nr:hypothetical protein [Raineya sp.]